jgi:hypothetical protein
VCWVKTEKIVDSEYTIVCQRIGDGSLEPRRLDYHVERKSRRYVLIQGTEQQKVVLSGGKIQGVETYIRVQQNMWIWSVPAGIMGLVILIVASGLGGVMGFTAAIFGVQIVMVILFTVFVKNEVWAG